jgi:uncharacterized Zn-binding protein involved in type VI secretion
MGLGLARVGDVGVGECCCHSDPTCISMTGTIINGSSNVLSNGLGAARFNDIVLGSCGHVGLIITGSPTISSNSLPQARVTSVFTGCFTGTIVTGSGDVIGG